MSSASTVYSSAIARTNRVDRHLLLRRPKSARGKSQELFFPYGSAVGLRERARPPPLEQADAHPREITSEIHLRCALALYELAPLHQRLWVDRSERFRECAHRKVEAQEGIPAQGVGGRGRITTGHVYKNNFRERNFETCTKLPPLSDRIFTLAKKATCSMEPRISLYFLCDFHSFPSALPRMRGVEAGHQDPWKRSKNHGRVTDVLVIPYTRIFILFRARGRSLTRLTVTPPRTVQTVSQGTAPTPPCGGE